jgi:outer membrane protein, heavy metal efflux system
MTRRIAGVRLSVAALALPALALAACTSTPPPAPLRPSDSAAAFGARRLEQLGPDLPTTATAWDRAQWLKAALRFNPQLAEARAHVAVSVAAERTAAQHANPTMNLFAEYVGAAAHSAAWLYGLSMDFLLRRPGDRARAIDYAAIETALAKSDLADSIWTVRAALRQSLLDVAASRDESGLLEALVAQRQTLLASDRARADAGDISRAQMLADELELSRVQQRLRQAQARGIDARSRLAAAVGVPAAALDGIPVQWDDWADVGALDAATSRDWRSEALIGRPQIVHALGEYDLAEIVLQNEVAKRWPEVHLTPGYAWGANGVREDPLNDFTQETALGVNFELPVFNQHQGPIGEALARREAAGQHLLAAQAEVFAQIDRAELAWPRALAAWQDAAAVVAIADRQQDIEQRSFSAGAGDRPALVSTQVAATEARLLQLAAAYQAQSTFGELEDAYRRPLQGAEGELLLTGTPQS